MNGGAKSLRDWVGVGEQRFRAAGIECGQGYESPWDEAAALVLHAMQLPADANADVGSIPIATEQAREIERLYRLRIARREPAAYLIGEAWFAGLPFAVDRRVLIPRSPIGELVERRYAPWLSVSKPSVLDLCTGGGCIAVATAHHLPEATVVGADISEDAVDVATLNARRLGVDKRCQIIRSDLFAGIPPRSFDLIVSNPPYVRQDTFEELPAEFQHEPGLALVAGEDGLDIAVRILAEGLHYLADDGLLILEVGQSAQALDERFPDVAWTWLEFARGGEGVVLMEAAEWRRQHSRFAAEAQLRGLAYVAQ